MIARLPIVDDILDELLRCDARRLAAVREVLRILREGRPREEGPTHDHGMAGPRPRGVGTVDGMLHADAALLMENVERKLEFGEDACVGGSGKVGRRQ
jgi:hypothetical protein